MTVRSPRLRHTTRQDLVAEASALLAAGWRLALAAAHEDERDYRIVYVFLKPAQAPLELWLPVPREDAWLPSLAAHSYPAGRFEREIRDLYGIRPEGHPLPYRLVRHAHWPTGYYPMRRDADPNPTFAPDVGSYPFLEVGGSGVYEIPVGPVHAGLIEPGHFRFSVVGETIVRMKARLWFLHRGIEKLFEGRPVEQGIELAERVSGDTAVGHSLGYAMAVEQAAQIEVSSGERVHRALLLELERLYNHVSDIGAIVNDVGFGIIHAHTQRLREQLLRHNKHVTGHRLLRGAVTIGGARLRAEPDLDLVADVAAATAELVDIAVSNHIVQDRLTGTAVLTTDQARALGTVGYVARASGLTTDARFDHPVTNLAAVLDPASETAGDVMARFLVRAREVSTSAALVSALARSAQSTSRRRTPHLRLEDGQHGIGVVEAWRGTLTHRVEVDKAGLVTRAKIVDPSFFNWPALPVALSETIVPDFPLANKSFNLSYAGNDL